MNRKIHSPSLMVGLISILMLSATVSAQDRRFPFSRSKPDEQIQSLTEKSGPWLIMVASFSGIDGEQQALRLANELRTKHRFKTYTYTHSFNFDSASQAMGYQVVELSNGETTHVPKTMTSLTPNRFNETAVLVGDFSSIEDPQAQRALEKVKSITPESMASIDLDQVGEDDDLAGGRLYAYRAWSNALTESNDGPLRTAFLLANPLLPEEYFQARKVDKLIISENTGLQYGLFSNPGAYSVRVATFTGAMIVDQNEINRIKHEEERKRRNREGLTESKLANAAKKAAILTRELRRQGYEAYEFHDRFESYVCVGSFDSLSKEDERGVMRMNPAIEETILKFKSQSVQQGHGMLQTQTFPLPRKFVEAGITCDVQPLPVLVPKMEETRSANRLLDRFR